MRQPNLVDGRNLWSELGLPEKGYRYLRWGVAPVAAGEETVLKTAEA
jgi:hypothetical protein